jgi:riboflavin biosynthesis pyrimidine reductase
MRPTLTRLHPAPVAPITVGHAYDVARPVLVDRPWVGLCMVASLDGSVSIDGKSGGLGNRNDLDVLLTLRELADMVLVGAGTANGEGYGPPKSPHKRIGVVTNTGRVDLGADLFVSGSGFLIAPRSADIDESRVEVLRTGETTVDLAHAVSRLHEVMPAVRYVQAEGGPRLNGALLTADLIDELDLSLSPRLVGGDGPRLTTGAPELDRRFELAHLLADDDGFVFSRWVRTAC